MYVCTPIARIFLWSYVYRIPNLIDIYTTRDGKMKSQVFLRSLLVRDIFVAINTIRPASDDDDGGVADPKSVITITRKLDFSIPYRVV